MHLPRRAEWIAKKKSLQASAGQSQVLYRRSKSSKPGTIRSKRFASAAVIHSSDLPR